MIIAYDFDGVFHKTVGKPDTFNQRSSESDIDYKPFDKIIDKIASEIVNNKIFIVTARSDSNQNVSEIKKFIKKTKLSDFYDDIYKIYTNDFTKVFALRNIMANEFYDDSLLRINEVYKAKQAGLLPNLQNIYLVRPESDDWIAINTENAYLVKIDELDNENNIDNTELINRLLKIKPTTQSLILFQKLLEYAEIIEYATSNCIYTKDMARYIKDIRNTIVNYVKKIESINS